MIGRKANCSRWVGWLQQSSLLADLGLRNFKIVGGRGRTRDTRPLAI